MQAPIPRTEIVPEKTSAADSRPDLAPVLLARVDDREVTQIDLENIVSLKNQIERLGQMRDRLAESVLRRMNAGAAVECGPRTADRDEEYRGPVLTQKLVVR